MTPFAIDLAVKGTILLILAFGTALLLRRASAAARHLHWQLALAGLLALPLLTAVTPRLAVPAGPLATLFARDEAPPVARSHATSPLRLAQEDPGRDVRREPARETVKPSAEPAARVPVAPPASARSRTPERAASPPPIFTFHFALTPLQRVLLLWAAGAALVLGLLGVGLLRAASLSRRATPVSDPAWLALLDRVRSELSLHRSVELRRVPSAIVPMTFGWQRPVVLLPADSDRWSVSRRRHVLLHELAHVRRGDWLGQIVAQAACAAWWWQPLAWIAARELRRHRELACDDAVLAAGNRASEYADDLLAIASSRRTGLATGTATLAMARRSQLEGRLLAVLEAGRRRAGPTPRRVLAATAGTAALVAALACVQPKSEAQPVEPTAPRPRVTYTVTDAAGNPVPGAIVTTDEPVDLVPQAAAPAARAPNADAAAPAAPPRHVVPAPHAPSPAAAPLPMTAELAPEPMQPRSELVLPSFYAARLAAPPQFTAFPAEPQEASFPAIASRMDLHFSLNCGDNNTNIWNWGHDDDRWTVTLKGCVEPDETVTKIASVDEDASFGIEHEHAGVSDKLQARGAEDEEGNSVVAWSGSFGGKDVSGAEASAAGEGLLAQALSQIGLFASERVNHLVATKGVPGALDAIRAMPPEGARSDMLCCLVREHELESEQLAAALDIAAKDGDGGAGLAELLGDLDEDLLGDPELVEPVFKAVESIESDSRQSEVLSQLVHDGSVEAPVLRLALLTAAKGLDSDAYAADFLKTIPGGRLRDPGVRDAWLAVLDTIESDAYASEVLQEALGTRGLKGDTLAALLDAATRGIDSDAYMAEVLKSAPPRALSDEAPRKSLVVALGTIESDAYMAEVLESLLPNAPPAAAAELLGAAAAGLDSDAYMTEALEALPAALAQDAQVRPALDKALATIQSPSHRQEVLEALGLAKDA